MLEVTDLHTGYRPDSTVLENVTIEVAPGSALGVMGRNGAGKSCLALTLAGILRPSRGSITLFGKDVTRTTARKRVRAGLSLVPEGRLVFAQLSVRENLVVAAQGAGRRLRKADITGVTDRFPVLGRKIDDRAAALSGGEQQLLAIARALVQQPRIVVFDEPALGLAPVAIAGLGETLRAILADGVALLLMEQNRDLLAGVCETTVLLDQGRLTRELSAAELRDDGVVAATYLGA